MIYGGIIGGRLVKYSVARFERQNLFNHGLLGIHGMEGIDFYGRENRIQRFFLNIRNNPKKSGNFPESASRNNSGSQVCLPGQLPGIGALESGPRD